MSLRAAWPCAGRAGERRSRVLELLRDPQLRFAVPDDDHSYHLAAHVGMRHGRALDEQAVALEADEAHLLAAHPGLVPGCLHLGDHFAAFDAIAARIGDHGAQRLGALLVALRHLAAVRGDESEPLALRGGDLAALGMLAQG